MYENSNTDLVNELEKHNEREGQQERIINPYPTVPSDPEFVEKHNARLQVLTGTTILPVPSWMSDGAGQGWDCRLKAGQ